VSLFDCFRPAPSGIERILNQILKEQYKIMAAIDDLKTAVANLGNSITNELEAISNRLSSLQPTGASDAEVEAVVQQLDALRDKVDAETATLSGNSTSAQTAQS
jgi:predicted  nucleic acid-binding Zn-ribbon protein